jgi:DNA polymerase-4
MRNQSLEFMQANFGKAGAYYYWVSGGVDHREVRANRIRKSVGAERFRTHGRRTAAADRQGLAALRGQGVSGPNGDAEGEVQRFRNHHPQQVRSRRYLEPRGPRTTVDRPAAERDAVPKPVRLLGVSLSSLQGDDDQEEPQLGPPV